MSSYHNTPPILPIPQSSTPAGPHTATGDTSEFDEVIVRENDRENDNKNNRDDNDNIADNESRPGSGIIINPVSPDRYSRENYLDRLPHGTSFYVAFFMLIFGAITFAAGIGVLAEYVTYFTVRKHSQDWRFRLASALIFVSWLAVSWAIALVTVLYLFNFRFGKNQLELLGPTKYWSEVRAFFRYSAVDLTMIIICCAPVMLAVYLGTPIEADDSRRARLQRIFGATASAIVGLVFMLAVSYATTLAASFNH